MKIVNLTPHTIDYLDPLYACSIPSSGVARATQTMQEDQPIIGMGNVFRTVRMTYGETTDLPDPDGETFYIVSAITAEAARRGGRTTDDLLLTADLVRDDQGRVVGCRAFARV